MKRTLAVALMSVTVAGFGVVSSAEAGKCALSSAQGIGITKEVAEFMSNKALKDMIAKNGEKGVGKVSTSCDSALVVTSTCVSKQRSCK